MIYTTGYPPFFKAFSGVAKRNIWRIGSHV
jgi:hypothetical protein